MRDKKPQSTAPPKNNAAPVLHGGYPLRFAAIKGQLTAAELRVGDFFLAHPESALLSITEVVEKGGLGYGTIIRFCRKIGCRGFQDFKVLLGRELAGDACPRRSRLAPS